MVAIMIGITLRQLEVFVGAIEADSFRACAERLSISQMAVSEHVRALEKRLGYPLLNRRGATATPTGLGRQAYGQARQILAATREFLSASGPIPEARRRLRVAAHGYIVETISKHLARFVSARPDLALELERRAF